MDWKYSQTCLKGSPQGTHKNWQLKTGDPLIQVHLYCILVQRTPKKWLLKTCDLLIQWPLKTGLTVLYIIYREYKTSGQLISNLWNEPSASFINFIWNDHECKILFIIWPFKTWFYRVQHERIVSTDIVNDITCTHLSVIHVLSYDFNDTILSTDNSDVIW